MLFHVESLINGFLPTTVCAFLHCFSNAFFFFSQSSVSNFKNLNEILSFACHFCNRYETISWICVGANVYFKLHLDV